MNLSKARLPSAVEVGGNFYEIKTDFRFWLNFSKMISDKDSLVGDFDIFYKGEKPSDRIEGINQLWEFYNPPKELPRDTGNGSTEQILDYFLDGELIYSAFYENYGIDLFDEKLKLHWHKFLALVSGLHDTKLNEIMSYRVYNPNDKTKYETQMMELKNAWRLPTKKRILSKAQQQWNALFDKKD